MSMTLIDHLFRLPVRGPASFRVPTVLHNSTAYSIISRKRLETASPSVGSSFSESSNKARSQGICFLGYGMSVRTRKGLRNDLLPLQRVVLGLDGRASIGVSRNQPGFMMTGRKRCHRCPDWQSHLPHQGSLVIYPQGKGLVDSNIIGEARRIEKKSANLIYESSLQVTLKLIPAWRICMATFRIRT